MRRIRRTAVAAAIAIGGVSAVGAASADASTFYAKYGNVNIRSGPGTGYTAIGTLIAPNGVASAGTTTGGAYSCFGFSGVKWRLVYPSYGNGFVGSACGDNV